MEDSNVKSAARTLVKMSPKDWMPVLLARTVPMMMEKDRVRNWLKERG